MVKFLGDGDVAGLTAREQQFQSPRAGDVPNVLPPSDTIHLGRPRLMTFMGKNTGI